MSNLFWQIQRIIQFAPNSLCKDALVCTQLRFRKPLRMGRAQTKEDKYFQKNPPTAKDEAKNLELYQNYNMITRSIVSAFQEQLVQKDNAQTTESHSKLDFWDEESHHAKCMAYNDSINNKMTELRMQRIKKLWKQRDQEDLKVSKLQLDTQARKRLEDLKKESENWLTLENMEDLITQAIDNPVSYNFSVRFNGVINSRIPDVL
uniref:Small ribosomal subunit protein mS26 n=1 Tax=Ciona savignyi TaxID=51511 RepID=H2ZLA4_CIOSA